MRFVLLFLYLRVGKFMLLMFSVFCFAVTHSEVKDCNKPLKRLQILGCWWFLGVENLCCARIPLGRVVNTL